MSFRRWVLFVLLCSSVCAVGSPKTSPTNMGKLTEDRYINQYMGFEFSLPAGPCSLVDESKSLDFAGKFPQRLSLAVDCGNVRVIFSAMPFRPDQGETLDKAFWPHAGGTVDALEMEWNYEVEQNTIDELPVRIAEFTHQSLSAYSVGSVTRKDFYVHVTVAGPEGKRAQLRKMLEGLKFLYK